jgi:prepilin-type processing-associated H-X9-DG protein
MQGGNWGGLDIFLGRRPVRRAFLATLLVGVLWICPAGPAAAQPPSPLPARGLPRADLRALIEFDGFDAHATDWKKTDAYRLLNETSLGGLLEDIGAQIVDQVASPGLPAPKGTDTVAGLERSFRNGFAIGSYGRAADGGPRFVVILKNGADAAVREPFVGRLTLNGAAKQPNVERRGRTIERNGAAGWWVEKSDLVLTTLTRPEDADPVLDVLDGKAPSVLDHPIRQELRKPDGAFKPALIAFLDATVAPPSTDGPFAGLRSVDYRGGFQGEALVSELRLLAPKPRQGVFALFDQPAFTTSEVPLPAGLTGFTLIALPPRQVFDFFDKMARQGDPKAQQDDLDRAFSEATGLGLRTDVLAHLGPKIALFARQPAPGTAPIGPVGAAIPELSLLVQYDDAAAVRKTLDKLIDVANEHLAKAPAAGQASQFAKLDGNPPGYTLVLPENEAAAVPIPGFAPTIVAANGYLVGSITRSGAERTAAELAKGSARWKPTGPFKTAIDALPKSAMLLSVNDPRDTLPLFVTNLPTFLNLLQQGMGPRGRGGPPMLNFQIDEAKLPKADELAKRLFPNASAVTVDDRGIRLVSRGSILSLRSPEGVGTWIALTLPAVQAAREAARRSTCVNNLKQIALAMHNYHAANNAFPASAVPDKDGKPLLSWRVQLLPYLEQGALYNEFHLDEPWDSPHNKELIERMPPLFHCPDSPEANLKKGLTTYRGYKGDGTVFEGEEPHSIAEITDGTSNTIMVVESKDAVPWTKPDDLPFDADPQKPFVMPSSPHPGGFNVAFCDGSVRFLKDTINKIVLRALITRNGGEVIAADAF